MSDARKGVSRRQLLTAGSASLAGALLLGKLPAAGWAQGEDPAVPRAVLPALRPVQAAGIVVREGGAKPVVLPLQGTRDPAVLSLAENLFWCDIMMEHARFIGLFLAGPELANLRSRALSYEGMFAGQLAKLQGVRAEESTFRRFNSESLQLTRAFVDFKHELHEEARTGRIRTLAFPSFFAHAAQEGERFINRLGLLSQGQPQLDRSEVIGFWSNVISDHLKLTAHMLDPTEVALIETVTRTAGRYDRFEAERPGDADPVIAAVEETIDLAAATEKGLDAGTIQGILHPALADHHRREAIKAADELRRVAIAHASR